MLKLFTRILIFPFLLVSLSGISQTELYSEDFNSTNTFSLNSFDVNSLATENFWIVNNAYPGGAITGSCAGFPGTLNVSATPDQPGGITAGPQSPYLHIISQFGIASGVTNSNFVSVIPTCVAVGNSFAKMTNGINTVGEGAITFSFWWLCGGGPQNFGETYYSVDGGVNWILVPGSPPQYFGNPNWQIVSYTAPAFMNQPDLRFAFRFVNEGTAGTLLSFAIDDVKITGAIESNSITTGAVNGAYCPGQSIQIPFSATGTFTAGNVFTAQMSDATGAFTVNLGTVTGTGNGVISGLIPATTVPGTYQIIVVSNQPDVTGTIEPITIAGEATAFIDPGSSTVVCPNSDAILNYNGTSGEIQWYSSTDGSIFSPIAGATNEQLIDGPLTAPTYYQVTVVSECGQSISDPWLVDLGGSAVIPLSYDGLNLCNGNIQVSIIGTFNQIVWSTFEANVNSIFVTGPGGVSVTGTDPVSGCLAFSETIQFIQTTPAVLTVTPQSPVTLCGSPVTITASPGFAEYLWSTGQSSPSIVISELPSVPLSVSAIDIEGCIIAPVSIQVIQGTAVTLPVTPSVAAVCDGEPAVLSAEAGFTDYEWSNGALGQNISVSLTGYYSVTAMDASGCPATSPLIEVIQSQFPIPNFTYDQNAGGYTITFDNTSQNGTEYSWYFDSLSTSPLENPVFTFPDNGPYYVTLIISNACGVDTITKLVLVALVGIEDLVALHNINVYPNPSSGDFNIAINNDVVAEFNIDVFDVTGRIIYSSMQIFSGNKTLNIPAEEFKSGLYFLRIQKDSASSVIKLIKE